MTKERIFSLIRNILTVVGGLLIGRMIAGTEVDAPLWENIVGCLMAVAGTVWGIFDKTAGIEMLQSTFRHLISTFSGIVVTAGWLTEEQVIAWGGVILALIPLLQGWLSRKKVQQIQSGQLSADQLKSK